MEDLSHNKKCVWYLRVSTSKQDYERQRSNLKEYAVRVWLEIVEWFEDKITGKSSHESRDGFNLLLDYLSMYDDVKIILFDEISRMWRDVYEQVHTKRALDKLGVEVWTVGMWKYAQTADGTLMFNLHSAISQYELASIRQRNVTWKFKAMENKCTISSIPPLWYNLRLSQRKKWGLGQQFEINEAEATLVREIFQIINEWGSTFDVQKQFARQGILYPRGHKWTWWHTTIQKILHNTTYYWEWRYGKSFRKEEKVIPVTDESLYTVVQVPIIVTREEWQSAQKILLRHKTTGNSRNTKNIYLLQSLLFCECGKRMEVFAPSTKRQGRKISYRCPQRNIIADKEHLQFVERKTCPISPIDTQLLNRIIVSTLWDALVDEKGKIFYEQYESRYKGLCADSKNTEKILTSLGKDIETLEKRILTALDRSIAYEIEGNVELRGRIDSMVKDYQSEIKSLQDRKKSYEDEKKQREEDGIDFDSIETMKSYLKKFHREDIEKFRGVGEKGMQDFLRHAIKSINVTYIREQTEALKSLAKDLRPYIYKKGNQEIRKFYELLYNRSHWEKRGGLRIYHATIIFESNFEMEFDFLYFGVNPEHEELFNLVFLAQCFHKDLYKVSEIINSDTSVEKFRRKPPEKNSDKIPEWYYEYFVDWKRCIAHKSVML